MQLTLLAAEFSFGNIINSFLQLIYRVLWWILMLLKKVFDFCYTLVRKIAGIDTYYYKGNEMGAGAENGTVTGDIIEVILKTDIVRNLLISLLVLGVILLIIITFVGIWKTEWDFGKDGNSKTKVINGAFRALINFIAVPVITFFGIFVGNALLRAIDSITRGSADLSMSNLAMNSLLYNAVRADHEDKSENGAILRANIDNENGNSIYLYFANANGDIDTTAILEAFKTNRQLKSKSYVVYDSDDDLVDEGELNRIIARGELVFSVENEELVDLFFDKGEVNYLAGYLALIFMLKSMLTITYGLVKRIFYMLMLFIVSPPVVALTPINDKILGNWRQLFIKNACCAFVTLGLYNIFMSIYPILNDITIFPASYGTLNMFTSLLFICVGLLTIDELASALNNLFGFSDLKSMSVDKSGKSLWGGAFGMAGKALKPATLPLKAAGAATKFFTDARYKGWKQAGAELGANAWNGIKNTAKGAVNAGPLQELWSNSGMTAVKDKNGNIVKKGAFTDFQDVKKQIKDYNFGDLAVARRNAIKEARNSFDEDAAILGGVPKGVSRDDFVKNVQATMATDVARQNFDKLNEKIRNAQNYVNNNQNLAEEVKGFRGKSLKEITNELGGDVAQAKKYHTYLRAEANIKKWEKELETKYTDADKMKYAAQDNIIKTNNDLNILTEDNAHMSLHRKESGNKYQTKEQREQAKRVNEAIARQTGRSDARNDSK